MESIGLLTPSLYVLNAAALTKPHAVEHLAADIASYKTDIAIITETHFKSKHPDGAVNIERYALFRRDRSGRRGGGVALYVRSTLHATVWKYSADDPTYEIHWVRVGSVFIAALYHPPKPLYDEKALLDYIEACVDEVSRQFPTAHIVIAGDLNQLPSNDVIERTGLTQIVSQPTRGANILDRVFVSCPLLYNVVRVVTSVVKSDHKAVVTYPEHSKCDQTKSTMKRTIRLKSPSQHALFLSYVANMSFENPYPTAYSDPAMNTQSEFDHFYSIADALLNKFYPERTITMTSRDPDFITPEIKIKLRRKNKLMRAGRVEEAEALSVRISKAMTQHGKTRLSTIDGKTDAKDVWATVRQLTGRQNVTKPSDGITAESLNDHYAAISSDPCYVSPVRKLSVDHGQKQYISDFQIFKILDKLRPTAMGLDYLPAWFLRLGAPAFYQPITKLFNLSLATSTVPHQWKQASILPIPKNSAPKVHADFRPISITPVLTRIMERTVVQQFLYPAFLSPPPTLTLHDQFAFRPTGSPTAAIISLLSIITNMLLSYPYVIVISLDFSKAFDTVRHSTLLEKLAKLDMPVNAFNWLVDFFSGHSHCTVYQGQTSMLKEITASVIQGSGLGPASYVINAGDLTTVTPGNQLVKFADDTYLVIPASNVDSRSIELNNIETWAMTNNLTLNRSKSTEIVFIDHKKKRQYQTPTTLPGIIRETSVKILGVNITNGLSASEHVRGVVSNSAQTLYALKVLRAHGMCDTALQAIFRSVIVTKLLYASSAWSGFIKEADRHRVDAFLLRSKRCGYCPTNLPSFKELCKISDEQLFNKVIDNKHHLLYNLLPAQAVASQNYHLRKRQHNRQLPKRTGHLTDSNFVTRMLYADSY
jgi:Reverse transcriptase (RNA-dependent DNA polymerase)/Endonuclease/Exonuclease/phosphatase family